MYASIAGATAITWIPARASNTACWGIAACGGVPSDVPAGSSSPRTSR